MVNDTRTFISMDVLTQIHEELYNLDLIYEMLVYDPSIYKQMANISFNVLLPLRETNSIDIEEMLPVDSVIGVSWHHYQRLITSSTNRYNSMVNLFNVLQYSFGKPAIKIKNPLDPKKDMYSSRQLDLMYESDESSKEHKECIALIEFYNKNKN